MNDASVDCEMRAPHDAASKLTDRQIDGLLDANVSGVMIADTAGSIHVANDALLEMHGFTREDMVAKRFNWLALTPEDWKPRALEFAARLFESGAPASYKKEHLHKDGHRIQLSVDATPIRDSDLVLVTLIDVSPRSPAGAINPRIAFLAAKERFGLTNREHEVLSLLLEGLKNAEIAPVLNISRTTVNDYVQNVMRKAGIQKRAQLFKRIFLE